MNRGVGNEHDQHDNWDEQRERLSAYIDGELPSAETQRLEAHLATCPECRRELAELRQLRALLRALPAPRPPRSFTLPETGTVPVPATVARRQRASRRRPSTAVARATQWAGGLAAAAGLLLVLGSALPGFGVHPFAGAPSGVRSSAAGAPASGNTSAPYQSPTSTSLDQHGSAVGPQSKTTHAPATAVEPTPATATPSTTSTGTINAGAETSGGSVPVLPLTGAGLVIGGGVLLVGGRVAERRGRRRR